MHRHIPDVVTHMAGQWLATRPDAQTSPVGSSLSGRGHQLLLQMQPYVNFVGQCVVHQLSLPAFRTTKVPFDLCPAKSDIMLPGTVYVEL